MGLSLLDEKGKKRVEVGSTAKVDEYGVYIYDKDKTRTFMGFYDGEYSLYFYDKKDIRRIGIGQDDLSGDSGLMLRDDRDVPRLILGQPVQEDGSKVLVRRGGRQARGSDLIFSFFLALRP